MNEVPETSVAEAIKTAFWITDVMTAGLPEMLAIVKRLAEHAPSSGAAAELEDLDEQIAGIAVALGILQGALAEIAMPGQEASE